VKPANWFLQCSSQSEEEIRHRAYELYLQRERLRTDENRIADCGARDPFALRQIGTPHDA